MLHSFTLQVKYKQHYSVDPFCAVSVEQTGGIYLYFPLSATLYLSFVHDHLCPFTSLELFQKQTSGRLVYWQKAFILS